ncbi:MAG: hypothetical protein OHK0022_47920 [Roseiflexaceae bacterium]
MSIRLRLALWYGGLFAAILTLVALLTYALHVRGHYDDRDRLLITSAGHMLGGMQAGGALPAGDTLEVGLRWYNAQGQPEGDSSTAPLLDPRAVLAAPAGPAFDPLAGLAPPFDPAPAAPQSAFGLISDGGQRWRAYVTPQQRADGSSGYLVAFSPLGHLDASIAAFRSSVIALGVFGIAAALAGGWAIAGRALRPIAQLTEAARTIAEARDTSHRVATPPHQDELHHLAETFNTMLASLEESVRAQQRFVADASHELRAPLTAIQANLELLRRRGDLPATEQDELLGEVEREAGRLTRLVADLLALARADAGASIRRAPVDLDAVVLETFQTARPLAQGQRLSLEPFEPLQVAGDADRLRQLVLILLDNALKYTPVGGSVVLGLCEQEGQASIVVRDTGMGIAAADLPLVFERFYRADPVRSRNPSGTGLGLSIARWIVTQHGGTIALESAPGQGTTVTVRLPLQP